MAKLTFEYTDGNRFRNLDKHSYEFYDEIPLPDLVEEVLVPMLSTCGYPESLIIESLRDYAEKNEPEGAEDALQREKEMF